MAFTRAVIGVSTQALRFHGGRSSSNPSLLPGNSSISTAGIHSSDSNCKQEDSGMVLRPGMVLLKGFLTEQEQVAMMRKSGVNTSNCPGTHNWTQFWYWDPQKRKYGEARRDDDSQPPFKMPHEFLAGVIRAIFAAQSLTRIKLAPTYVKDILPMMSPDTCKLDFHAPGRRSPFYLDREDYETYESLANGLPIVSFSLGDSAEFVYGDCRDTNLAKKMVVESGDVVIFGGLSRLIFQDVGSVIPGTAPKYWLDNSGVHPGRFNLSFREF